MTAAPQSLEGLAEGLHDYAAYAKSLWRIADKTGALVTFNLTPAQKLVDAAYERQMAVQHYATTRALHRVLTVPHSVALTLAHEQSLPEIWLQRCRWLRDQLPTALQMRPGGTRANALSFDGFQSRYYVGSVQSGFPGMGDTISYLHLSEVGSWDKSPILVDPDAIMADLTPALPTGAQVRGTVQIRESTGRVRGDWWHRTWQAAKSGDTDFQNIFLPWFLVPEYRRDDLVPDIRQLSAYERDVLLPAGKAMRFEVDKAQLAWRRHKIRQSPWFGDAEAWGAQFPATEQEAFLSPGQSVFTTAQISAARATVRPPIWRGDVVVGDTPSTYQLDRGDGGHCLIWERPDERYHYVLGADCRWGTRDTSDWDVGYVQCLETMRICARIRGRFDLALWGKLLAALGFHYNTAVLAPERNSVAATALMPLLLGNVAPWRYPRIYIRAKDVTIRPRFEDYGWLTDANSKGDIIALAKAGTLAGTYDWADELAVDEAESWVHDEKTGNPGAPKGSFDDALMSRMITAYVARRERTRTDLYVEPVPAVYKFRTAEERVREDVLGEGGPEETP